MTCYGLRMTTNADPQTASPESTSELINSAIKTAERTKKFTAEKAGIPVSTFLRKLNGYTDFTVGEVARIARALDVPAGSLLPAEFATTNEASAAA